MIYLTAIGQPPGSNSTVHIYTHTQYRERHKTNNTQNNTKIHKGCPTRYRARHFFNKSNTNEDIATKFEQKYVRCVRNEEECGCSVCLFRCNIVIGVRIIKEMPGSVSSGTPCRTKQKYIELHKNQEECGQCPVFADFTLAFALKLRKKHGKTSVRVIRHKHKMRIHSHNNKNI